VFWNKNVCYGGGYQTVVVRGGWWGESFSSDGISIIAMCACHQQNRMIRLLLLLFLEGGMARRGKRYIAWGLASNKRESFLNFFFTLPSSYKELHTQVRD
jgi:hypothetical protein